MLSLLRPQVLLERLLLGQAQALQASVHVLSNASAGPSLSAVQCMRTRRRSMCTHAHNHAHRHFSMPHFAPQQQQQQEAREHPQQPPIQHAPPLLHTNDLLHLLSARMEDLHTFGVALANKQTPRRVAAHASQLQHVASQLTQSMQSQHSSLHQHAHHDQRLLSTFRSALEGGVARKLSALGAFQRSVAVLGASEKREAAGGGICGAEAEVVHICRALNDFKLQVDAQAVRFPRALQYCTELAGWWDDPRRVHALDAAMDSHEAFTLSMRLLVSEFLSALGHWWHRHGLQGLTLSTADEGSKESSRWSMAGPQGPPGFDPHAPPRPLINLNVPLVPLLQLTAEDTRAFCIEKNSTAPEVVVVPAPGAPTRQPPTSPTNSNRAADSQQQQQQQQQQCVPVVLDAYVEHVFSELLKNAMQALISKWGAWDVDEADPILVEVDASQCFCSSTNTSSSSSSSSSGSSSSSSSNSDRRDLLTEGPFFSICITDTGGGIPGSKLHSLQHYFGTTHAPREATYGYSRDFGAKFQGQGVGAPLSRLYARFMGGALKWAHVLDNGQEVPLDQDQVTEGVGVGSERAGGSVVGTRTKLLLPCHGFSF